MISFGGAPHLGFSIDPTQARFNSLSLVDGAWPKANEVVIDRKTAGKKDINVGDTIRVEAQGKRAAVPGLRSRQVRSVEHRHRRRNARRLRPAERAETVRQGRASSTRSESPRRPGVSEAELLQQIRQVLPAADAGSQRDGAGGDGRKRHELASPASCRSSCSRSASSPLFVGAFVIANSLSITITQRTREFATLRTIGASRRQIRRSVLLESFIIGLGASIIGLFLGLALAKGLFWIFDQFGFTLPNTGLLFKGRDGRSGRSSWESA